MSPAWPRYLLLADTLSTGRRACGWRFLLQSMESEHHVAAMDREREMRGDRLALMAVVRGLEALDQPSAVKLVTTSNYVRRGVSRGLAEWKRHNWKWERFGQLTTIRDEDLWRRIDQAMTYHQVSCRGWRNGLNRGGQRPHSREDQMREESLAERVAEGVINEPALLIVRGKRRQVAPLTPGLQRNRLPIAG